MHILQMKLNGNQMKYFWIILNSTEHANLEKLICQKTPSGCSIDSGYQHTWHAPTQGFPSEINCWGHYWRKQLKTSWKEQNQHFGGKTVCVYVCVCVCVCLFLGKGLRKHWKINQSFGWWGVSRANPPIMENPATFGFSWQICHGGIRFWFMH